jgi:hypothetical protein
VQGLVAVMLSLKKKPLIRYEKMSSMARKLAHELQVQFIAFYIDSPQLTLTRPRIASKPSPNCSISG